jgi:hypothetical protein
MFFICCVSRNIGEKMENILLLGMDKVGLERWRRLGKNG